VRKGPRWYLGAAAAWAWLNLGGRGANGVAVEPLVGYLYDGSGGLYLHVELGYAVNLFQEQQMDRLIPGSDASHWSHGPLLLVGMAL